MARRKLDRDKIVNAAFIVGDKVGLHGVSMRTVAAELGVQAMSLYHHVATKEALLDAIVERLFRRLDPPDSTGGWRALLQAYANSLHQVIGAHPWTLPLVDSRSSRIDDMLAHRDAMLGALMQARFTSALAVSVMSTLDAFVYGFVLTEASLPFNDGETAESLVEGLAVTEAEYPNMARFVHEHIAGGGYDFAEEFNVGLDIILDGLELRFGTTNGSTSSGAKGECS